VSANDHCGADTCCEHLRNYRPVKAPYHHQAKEAAEEHRQTGNPAVLLAIGWDQSGAAEHDRREQENWLDRFRDSDQRGEPGEGQ
jgi:hypothetical protein